MRLLIGLGCALASSVAMAQSTFNPFAKNTIGDLIFSKGYDCDDVIIVTEIEADDYGRKLSRVVHHSRRYSSANRG